MHKLISALAILFVSAAFAQDVPQTKLVPIEYDAAADSQTSVEPSSHAPKRSQLQRNEDNTFWKFTAEQPYHAAAVRVSAGSAGGSGTLVGTDGDITLMVTNHHVVETGNGGCASSVVAYLRDGREFRAYHMLATPTEDVAVYRINRNDLPCVAVSSENAPVGALIDTMGFGGPWHHKSSFRPFVAKTVPTSKALAIDAPAISGDSGSGMIWNSVLVGVNWGADSVPTQSAGVSGGQSIPLVYPATSSANATFLQRFLTQACGPFGCSPIIGRPGYLIPRGDQSWDRQPRAGGQFPGPEQFYRPEGGGVDLGGSQDELPISQPQTTPPANAQCPPCSCNGCNRGGACNPQANVSPGAAGPAGEQGPAGPAGPAGPKGDPGKDGEVTPEQLAAIAAAITQQLKADPSLKGPKGDRGEPGAAGPKGERGPEGANIANMHMDDNYNVYVTYSNGRKEQIGNLKPKQSTGDGQVYFDLGKRKN